MGKAAGHADLGGPVRGVRRGTHPTAAPEVPEVADELASRLGAFVGSGGTTTVGEISASTGWSRQHLDAALHR